MFRIHRSARRCPGMMPALFLLAAVCIGSGPALRADLLTTAVGHEVSAAEGVVYVWSEFPPQGIEAVIGYPAWGYRFHPSYATVDCDVDPEEALVILDGETLGEADDYDGFPSYLFISPGQHQLEFKAEGRQLLVLRGSFLSGAFIRVDRELERDGAPMLVELGEPVDVGGGEQPPYQPPVLPPDDGPAGPVGPTTAPDPAADTREQGAAAGFLELQVTPVDAAVYIDDRFFGSGDEIARLHGYIRLAAGEHTIQVTRPGYRARTLVVPVTVGEKQHLDVWLEQAAPPGE